MKGNLSGSKPVLLCRSGWWGGGLEVSPTPLTSGFEAKNLPFRVLFNFSLTLRFIVKYIISSLYRSGMLNSNTVNSKFHLIQSFCEIFARFLLFHV